jgi:D-3-phosphoglycerate dehydrogenase
MDPFFAPQKAEEMGITLVQNFHEMLPQIDFLTVHTPLNDQTRGMFGKKELELVKKGAKLINCARGGIYDLDTLVEGMKSGKLGGVALDVYEEEPCTKNPLFGMKNVVCTPHLGASTEEAQTNVALEAVELLIAYFTNGTIRQAVNFGTLDAKTLAAVRGYLDVAYRLGILTAQLGLGTIKSVKMKYKGEVSKKDTKLVSTAFAAGLMSAALSQDVNIVSAASMLHERGIEQSEEKTSEIGDFASLLTAEIVGETASVLLTGTLFGNSMPRLVMMNNFRLESFLDGNQIVLKHRDQPGVIGGIGTLLAKKNINISAMSSGRSAPKPGGEAITVISIDSEPTMETLKEIDALPAVSKACYVKLPAADKAPAWMG